MTSKGGWQRPRFGLVVVATALISYSVLIFEVVLTRIFSVILSYNFVFAVISFALLGLGLGGMMLWKWSRWLPKTGYHTNAALLACMIAGSVIGIIKLPIYESEVLADFGFWIYIFLATLPFFFAGLTLAGIFQEFAENSSTLYGADLLGATLGALSVVPLLNGLGGVNATLFASATAVVATLLLGLFRQKIWSGGAVPISLLSLGLIAVGWFALRGDVPIARDLNKDMYRMLANPLDKLEVVESRWSAFGRTDLVRSVLDPAEMTLFVDGAAGSAMFNFDSLMNNPARKAHITTHFSAYFPFYFLKEEEKNSALIIGSGGGRDAVMALLGGVSHITAVEVNPDVVQMVKDYAWYNGGIYTDRPEIKAVVAEGRNYIRSTHANYDLIMLAIPITKSSRSVEGYALTENYLFTVDSMQDYLDRLTPEGRIVIVAHNEPEIYRLIALALTAFERQNIAQPDAMQHIYTIASGMMPAIVIKKQPFEPVEIEKRHAALHELGFDKGSFFVPYEQQIVLQPNQNTGLDSEWRMFDQILVDISTGKLNLHQLLKAALIDISPVTDDSPFFYKFEPGLPQPFGLFTLLIVLAGGSLIGLVMIPKAQKDATPKPKYWTGKLALFPQLKFFLLLFFFLGLGFMLVEIALFQKLTLFLGHPVLALTVLLFSLLLGSGLGSLASSVVRKRLPQTIATTAFIVCALTVVYAFYLPAAFNLGLESKVTATLLLLPLGLVMGFPFPLLIRLMKEYGFGDSIHLMWGVNGIASVLGSALAMIIGILSGFSYALFTGALLYAGVGGLAVLLRRNKAV